MTILLALDTATEACSVALQHNGAICGRHEIVGRGHTQALPQMLQGLLAEAGLRLAQVDAFVCSTGPGSFAGVRIGVGFVKGLALGLDRPVIPLSSLQLLAEAALLDPALDAVVSAIDARMREIYLGTYVRDPAGRAAAREPDRCLPPDAVQGTPAGRWAGVGTGWGTYHRILVAQLGEPAQTQPEALPDARHAFGLALPRYERRDWMAADELAPVYLRDQVALTLEQQARLRADRAAAAGTSEATAESQGQEDPR